MVTEIVKWSCNKCGNVYNSCENAERCERSPDPPVPCKVGDEVRLWNRGHGSWTLAVCLGQKLRPTIMAEILADRPHHLDAEVRDFHLWELVLDREVCLDHTWENGTREVPSFYLCPAGATENLPRQDNNASGVVQGS